MKKMPAVAVFSVLALSGCAGWIGKDEATLDFEKETSAGDARMREDKTRMSLGALESALADYVKAENKIPAKLDALVPKYLAAIPMLDVPVCGGETDRVESYPAGVLRDGQVDGARLRGTGRWGYVHNDDRVVVFVDCLKPSGKNLPWYQERGVY